MGGAFTYWDTTDLSPLSPVLCHWQGLFGGLEVIGDREVVEALRTIDPDFIDPYLRIRIPAAQSDLARLIMLYERGGLYVNSHCGVIDADRAHDLLQRAQSADLILVDGSRQQREGDFDRISLINAMMAGGRRSSHLRAIMERVIDNLRKHFRSERDLGFAPYDLIALTGPAALNELTIDASGELARVRQDIGHPIEIINEDDFPIQRYRYRIVRETSSHWRERQKRELLFRL